MATIQSSIKLTDGMTPALQSMNKALNLVLNSFESMQRVSSSSIDTRAIQTARQELARAQVSLNAIEDEINQNRAAQERFNNSVQNGTIAAGGLWDKIKGIATAYVGFQSVKSLVAASDAYTSNVARIDMMNDGLQTTAELQQKIYEASQRSLTSYGDMTDVVAKLGITAGHSFKNNDEMVAFAEILNKQFALSGTGGQEKSAAMYQLTQAMASGKLQGDEFRSILENAPMLAQTIAKHMGMTLGQLREVSSEGKITSDIIKNALFSVAEETNAKFANMPMTWADLWVQMTNKVNKGLEPLYIKIRDMWNNPKVQTFLDSLVNGFLMVATAGIHVFEMLSSVFSLIHSNWDFIESILIGVASVYLPTIISLLWAKVTALAATAAAWLAVNWHILLIATAIAGVIMIARHMGITFADVCGVIAGGFEVLGAVVTNIFIGMYNIGSGVIQAIYNTGVWLGANLATVFNNIGVWWNNLWIDAKVGFYSFINDVLSKLSSLASKIQPLAELLGFDLSGMVGNVKTSIDNKISSLEAGKQKTEAYTAFKEIDWSSKDYMSLSKAWNEGKASGSALGNKAGEMLSGIEDRIAFDLDPSLGTLGKSADNPLLAKIADNTGNIADNTSVAANNEDLSYMRDLAEREAINRYTLTDLKVEMNNNNNINNEMDMDSVVEYLQKKVYESILSTAEGVHF